VHRRAAGVGIASVSSTASIAALASILAAGWAFGSLALGKQRAWLERVASERRGESICQFAHSFDPREVDTWVVRAVYETCQQELEFVHTKFPVRASDKLRELLFDPDDLDMAIAPEVGRRAGRSLANAEMNPLYGKVYSVADLVLFFNAQPKTNET